MLLFLFILFIAYIYMFQPAPVDQQTIDNRLAKRAEVEAKQKALVNEYAWVNQKEGQVRVPVELAMKLAVKEIDAKPGESIFPPAETASPAPASTANDADKAEEKTAEAVETSTKTEPAKDKTAADEATEGDASAEATTEKK